jgi:hypothetical protein
MTAEEPFRSLTMLASGLVVKTQRHGLQRLDCEFHWCCEMDNRPVWMLSPMTELRGWIEPGISPFHELKCQLSTEGCCNCYDEDYCLLLAQAWQWWFQLRSRCCKYLTVRFHWGSLTVKLITHTWLPLCYCYPFIGVTGKLIVAKPATVIASHIGHYIELSTEITGYKHDQD